MDINNTWNDDWLFSNSTCKTSNSGIHICRFEVECFYRTLRWNGSSRRAWGQKVNTVPLQREELILQWWLPRSGLHEIFAFYDTSPTTKSEIETGASVWTSTLSMPHNSSLWMFQSPSTALQTLLTNPLNGKSDSCLELAKLQAVSKWLINFWELLGDFSPSHLDLQNFKTYCNGSQKQQIWEDESRNSPEWRARTKLLRYCTDLRIFFAIPIIYLMLMFL